MESESVGIDDETLVGDVEGCREGLKDGANDPLKEGEKEGSLLGKRVDIVGVSDCIGLTTGEGVFIISSIMRLDCSQNIIRPPWLSTESSRGILALP
mmetsp:Transcript_33550/g.38215  ORF Transcript_33550/g.38215 Transcript_33550/m.38215 type:complete len:97 (-) Transcript_33550:99-389(-)